MNTLTCCLLLIFGSVLICHRSEAQFFVTSFNIPRQPPVRRQGPTDTRLGLVGSQLGVPPVPGVSGASQPLSGGREDVPPTCQCLPSNQLCHPNIFPGGPSSQGSGGASNIGLIDRRIVTQGGQGPCPQDRQLCCLGGASPSGHVIPAPQAPIGVPNSVGGTCGIPNPIPFRTPAFGQATFGEFPWMAVVTGLNNEYYGGGALIAGQWVLTAAHKVFNKGNLRVRLGDYDVQQPVDHPQHNHVTVDVSQVIIHPNYNDDTLQNDIALLRLSRSILSLANSHIGPACLPHHGQLFGSQRCVVTGWGVDAFAQGTFQNVLKKVEVPIVDSFRCEQQMRSTRLGSTFMLDKHSFLCAGGEPGNDACKGDGGSPLVCNTGNHWSVVGLVAWGVGCAANEVPGVYVNVPNYVNFIRQYVRNI